MLVPWGANHYASGMAQAMLDCAEPGAHLIFSFGWYITLNGKDLHLPSLKREEQLARQLGRPTPFVDIGD